MNTQIYCVLYCKDTCKSVFLADIDECSTTPCVNGQCENGANQYTCTCDAGWTGTNCDTGTILCYYIYGRFLRKCRFPKLEHSIVSYFDRIL